MLSSSGAMYSQKSSVTSSQSQTNNTTQSSSSSSSLPKSSFHMMSSHQVNNNQYQNETSKNNQNNGNVKFSGHFKDKIDEREKYLTAKYPNHQMLLIKKRLKVEFWIDEQLKHLFDIKDDNTKEDHDICPDDLVDTLLDMDTDSERKFHLIKQLKNAKMSKETVLLFVDELLIKLRML